MTTLLPCGHGLRAALALLVFAALASACGGSEPPPAEELALTPIEQQGLSLFRIHCAPCHDTGSETVIVGPSLKGIATTASERVEGMSADAYLRASILKPYDFLVEGYTETMPPDFGKRLTGEEFDALMAYLLTLE